MIAKILAAITEKYGRKPTAEELAKELNGAGLLMWAEKVGNK